MPLIYAANLPCIPYAPALSSDSFAGNVAFNFLFRHRVYVHPGFHCKASFYFRLSALLLYTRNGCLPEASGAFGPHRLHPPVFPESLRLHRTTVSEPTTTVVWSSVSPSLAATSSAFCLDSSVTTRSGSFSVTFSSISLGITSGIIPICRSSSSPSRRCRSQHYSYIIHIFFLFSHCWLSFLCLAIPLIYTIKAPLNTRARTIMTTRQTGGLSSPIKGTVTGQRLKTLAFTLFKPLCP